MKDPKIIIIITSAQEEPPTMEAHLARKIIAGINQSLIT